MRIGRCCAVVLSLCFPIAAPAQTRQGDVPAARGQAGGSDILVTGTTEKASDWKRAETDHLIVVSHGGEAELASVTRNLERLYYLMSRLYRRGEVADQTVKIQVFLVDSRDDLKSLGLLNARSGEGPFIRGFSDQRYYDPRPDGEVIAVARVDQRIELNTNRRWNNDNDALDGEQGADRGNVPYHPPIVRSWESVLYSAFAQHFILTYAPAAYPRWYLDGIGALFSTIDVKGDGRIDYARAPLSYSEILQSYGDLDVGDVLTGRYLAVAPGKTNWTPYHAGLLAHFFLFSDLKPDRSRQFSQYMAAIHQGTPMAEAARVFGDMRKLQREFMSYAARPTSFAHTDQPQASGVDPLVTRLSPGNAALIQARLELGARLAAFAGSGGGAAVQAPVEADWLTQLRDRMAQLPYDADAILVAGEIECRSAHADRCLADAERVLARSPDNVRAMALKGMALTDRAMAGPIADRAATLAAARRTIERAIELDDQAPLPLIAYFQSFTKAGEPVPDRAMLGMAKVIQRVPAAPGPRLDLGEELVRQGNAELAHRVLYVVLYGAYDSPERELAMGLFPPAAGQRSMKQ